MSENNNGTYPVNSTSSTNTLLFILDDITVQFLNQLLLVITILGLIGFIGNSLTFLQRNFRYNSFCIYTLCGSLVDITNILINLFPNYLTSINRNLILMPSNSFLCKFKLFILVFLPQLSINLLIMSLIDRYICTYSLTSPMRHLIKLKTVPWVIGIIIVITCIISLYAPILHDIIPGYGCISTYPTLNGVLYILIHGLLTPGIMFIIVLLTYRRFKRSRRRVGATGILSINRYRNQFIVMAFAQAFVSSFLALQWIITYWYFIATLYDNKSIETRAITMFALTLTNNFYYLINVKSFYLSTLTSRLFRDTLIKALFKLLPRHVYQRN